ncbi:MAG: M55 family metallopeptidase [Cyanobacteria bacterium HKST-UBA06]|nr:M55 family metallopeptidase [Cyanobacteria bacterium HKST-UBA06]
MARYYISADLEGIVGVVNPRQCYPAPGREDGELYQRALLLAHQELTLLIGALLDCDETAEVVINDAHSGMLNLDINQLPEGIRLLSGKPKVAAMMAGLDNGFDAAMLIGYHAKPGTRYGVLNHAFHHGIANIDLNGVSVGEAAMNTLWAQQVCQVPVVLGAGDAAFCTEFSAFSPAAATVETKVGLSTTSARSHSLEALAAAYHGAVTVTFSDWSALTLEHYQLDPIFKPPYAMTLTMTNTLYADAVALNPLFDRVDGLSLTAGADSFEQVYRTLQSGYMLLGSTDQPHY